MGPLGLPRWFNGFYAPVQPECLVTLEKIARTAEVAKVPIEPEVGWLSLQVPLAGHGGEVTTIAQHLRRGDRMAHRRITCSNTILASQQRHAGRVTLRRVVKLREPQSTTCQRIQVRRFDLTAVAPKVREPQVVRHDDNDVGTLDRMDRCEQRQGQDGRSQETIHSVRPFAFETVVVVNQQNVLL